MLGTINLATFIISGIGLNLYPGQDTFYIITRSLSQGKKAGIMSVLGISTGGLCHTMIVGLGLSSILFASPEIFMFIKIAGALYLMYLGVRFLFNKKNTYIPTETYLSKLNNLQIYRQGLLTNLLNPKVALFFLSFLPQFVDPVNSRGFISFFFLGFIFLTTGTIWCLIVALFSAQVSQKLRQNPRCIFYLEKATGFIFIGIAVTLFFN
jgi:threonine/homoserine/homoserine lactone efflux protein